MVHCSDTHGVVLHFADGTKISYSGDTRPCEQFIKDSAGVDLMIHEATFLQDLLKNAIENKHSTALEAIEVAYKAGAKKLVLTHFSQRYRKLKFE